MKGPESLRVIAEVTTSQWGMVTAAQARALGVSRLTLSRLAEAGHLERLAHGVYRDAGAPSGEFEGLQSAWLSVEPKFLAEERLRDLKSAVVVASTSAATLHGIGDFWSDRHEFVVAKRRQTQRPEIRYRQRRLESRDITVVQGLPVMRVERTLADLLDDVKDISLVTDALSAAVKKYRLDLNRMRELLSVLAERNGFQRNDGNAVLEYLLDAAGFSIDAIAQKISSDFTLSSQVVTNYFRRLAALNEMPTLDAKSAAFKQFVASLSDEDVQKFLDATREGFKRNSTSFDETLRQWAQKLSWISNLKPSSGTALEREGREEDDAA